ncbi:MAG: PepSY domain-containing protein [Actinomycetota bacterium]
MQRRAKWISAGIAGAAILAGGGGIAVAASGGDDNEAPISGSALERASSAALEHTGGGRVTETEVGDEESYYEVEVTLDDGRQVEVQLDERFNVVGSSADEADDDEDGADDD